MRKVIALLIMAAIVAMFAGCQATPTTQTETTIDNQETGTEWQVPDTEVPDYLVEEEKQRFFRDRNTDGLQPVVVLAEQEMEGMNYAYLSHGSGVFSGGKEYPWSVQVIHEDPEGHVSWQTNVPLDVTGIFTIDTNDTSGLLELHRTSGWNYVEEGREDRLFSDALGNFSDESENGRILLTPVVELAEKQDEDKQYHQWLCAGVDTSGNRDIYVVEYSLAENGSVTLDRCEMLELLAYVADPVMDKK